MKKEKPNIFELAKLEKRRKALGRSYLCTCDFAGDNGENPVATLHGKNFVERFETYRKNGGGLILFGPAGCGKTYLAAEIVNALSDLGYQCRYTSMLAIMNTLNTLSPESRTAFLEELCSMDLLVLDDFGKESETWRCNDILNLIVSVCHEKQIPLIVSTPLSQDDFVKENENSKRSYAIHQILERCLPLVIPMPGSRRARNLKNKEEAKAMLSRGLPCPARQQLLPPEDKEEKEKGA